MKVIHEISLRVRLVNSYVKNYLFIMHNCSVVTLIRYDIPIGDGIINK